MSEAYVGEIRMFGFSRVPNGWLACDGSIQPINQFDVLYTLLGTTYGGNGTTNFAVPDLRGRIPIHQGNGQGLTPRVLGQISGTEQVTLLGNQIPPHTHLLTVSTQAASAATPGNTVTLAAGASGTTPDTMYFTPPTGGSPEVMSPNTCQNTGGSVGHDNCAPTLTVSFCICWAGLYPSQG